MTAPCNLLHHWCERLQCLCNTEWNKQGLEEQKTESKEAFPGTAGLDVGETSYWVKTGPSKSINIDRLLQWFKLLAANVAGAKSVPTEMTPKTSNTCMKYVCKEHALSAHPAYSNPDKRLERSSGGLMENNMLVIFCLLVLCQTHFSDHVTLYTYV